MTAGAAVVAFLLIEPKPEPAPAVIHEPKVSAETVAREELVA
jgi:hypothetical protein